MQPEICIACTYRHQRLQNYTGYGHEFRGCGMTEARLHKLRKQRDALDAQIKSVQARARQQARKRDTRRKVLAGAAVLHAAELDLVFARQLHRMLDGFLARDDERALFDLPPRAGN